MNAIKLARAAAPYEVALQLASCDIIGQARESLRIAGVIDAVALHDPEPIFDWLNRYLAFQGISDRAALTYQDAHGQIRWKDVQATLRRDLLCPRLRSWWHFECGYRKGSRTCAENTLLESCDLPKHQLRKGSLNQAAFGLGLFLRDVCDGDLVGWIDQRVASADTVTDLAARGRRMAAAVTEPLTQIRGTGSKLWHMLMADLLLGADPERERWVAAGASMIAIDSLVHNFLHRTGLLREHRAEHAYGPRCHDPTGCAGVVELLANEIDASAYHASLPSFSPRLVQSAIWRFCAEGRLDICNGRNIDDRYGCRQPYCPASRNCPRLPLRD